MDYNETVKIMKTKTKQASIRSMFASQLTPNSPNNSFIHGENSPHIEEKVSEGGEVHLYEEEGLLCPDECCHHGGLHPGLLPGHAGGCAVLAVSKS